MRNNGNKRKEAGIGPFFKKVIQHFLQHRWTDRQTDTWAPYKTNNLCTISEKTKMDFFEQERYKYG